MSWTIDQINRAKKLYKNNDLYFDNIFSAFQAFSDLMTFHKDIIGQIKLVYDGALDGKSPRPYRLFVFLKYDLLKTIFDESDKLDFNRQINV